VNTLLGHLAQFGSFLSQGEVLCTQGLTHLLQDTHAKSSFAAEITRRTGVELTGELTWHAEAFQPHDRGRPDLEARSFDDVPLVKIEAKLGAALSADQLYSYASGLQGRSSSAVLLVLVPRQRTDEARAIVTEAFGPPTDSRWHATDVTIAVICWEDVLASLRGGGSERSRHEVEQLEEMYQVLSGLYIAPLAGPEDLAAWRERETDFVNLVERATRRLTTDHRLLPMGVEPLEQVPEGLEPMGYQRRYVCRPLAGSSSCYCVGARDPFAGSLTPIWLRFNKTTPGFQMIAERLRASHLEPRLLSSSGHVWIPLDLPFRVDDERMVDALVAEAEEVAEVAYEGTG